MTRRPGWMTIAAALTLSWGCGPSENENNNQQQQHDAYVFPDSRPRPDAAACEDRCTQGTKQCVTGGYQECGNYDSDSCYEWGPVVPCDPGEKCEGDGECVAQTCTNECVEGAVKCTADGLATQDCEQSGDCWVWADPVDCPGGETCSGGVCSATCQDDCATGSRRCDGDGFQVCGDFDSDDCLDWGPTEDCDYGETCSNGYCESECTNECTAGSTRCAATNGTQNCGDFDSDVCLEWGPVIPCESGETCTNGACSATCTNECAQAGDRQCTPSGRAYQTCAEDPLDNCLKWGPEVNCDPDQTCENGQCVDTCDCDFYPGICEPAAPQSTTPCSCDPDCSGGGQPCQSDGHCDTWCPANQDPDCNCTCDYNEYCEAAENYNLWSEPPSIWEVENCPCDPDCELHEWACEDDGHCDTWCLEEHDPDCPAGDECRDRDMWVGWRYADEMWLSGSYEDPDPDEDPGDYLGWVLLSPGLSAGSAEIWTEFAAEHVSCVTSIKISVYGYDDSLLGDGAEVYLYNWDTFQFDLLPDETVGYTLDYYDNQVSVTGGTSPYLLCGSGSEAKCYIDAKVGASAWDNTHLYWVDVYVHMTP